MDISCKLIDSSKKLLNSSCKSIILPFASNSFFNCFSCFIRYSRNLFSINLAIIYEINNSITVNISPNINKSFLYEEYLSSKILLFSSTILFVLEILNPVAIIQDQSSNFLA